MGEKSRRENQDQLTGRQATNFSDPPPDPPRGKLGFSVPGGNPPAPPEKGEKKSASNQ